MRGAGAGNPAGCARRSRSSHRPTSSMPPARPGAARARRGRGCGSRHDEHEQRERDQHQRYAAVEAPGLRVRPRVQRPDDLAALVGVRAGLLARAAVADVRLGAVAHEPPLVVELVRATGAGPPGTARHRAGRRTRSRRCGSAASAGACAPTATRARRRRPQQRARSRRRASPRRSRRPRRGGLVAPVFATPAGSGSR